MRKRNLSRREMRRIGRNLMLGYMASLLLGFFVMLAVATLARAAVGDTFPEIGCTADRECYSMLCTEITMQREHCVKVPMPRARPVVPCDTDSDCERKNGGDGY